MNVREMKFYFEDFKAKEYMSNTKTLAADDLKNDDLMLAALVLSHESPIRYEMLNDDQTTLFYSRSSTPIAIKGIRVNKGFLVVEVTGQKTPRIQKRWTNRFKKKLGTSFEDVAMEWV